MAHEMILVVVESHFEKHIEFIAAMRQHNKRATKYQNKLRGK